MSLAWWRRRNGGWPAGTRCRAGWRAPSHPALRPGRRLLLLGVVVGAALVAEAPAGAQEPFPHDEHARLFPLCTGCHQGVPSDDAEARFPSAALCSRCHDGVQAEVVAWAPPTPRQELVFAHPEHDMLLAREDTALACTDCHGEQEGQQRLAGVFRASHSTCASCHAHATSDHYVTGACGQCHVPLAETRWSPDRVATLTVPGDHDPPDAFLAEIHGSGAEADLARCSTCHTRDVCTACHVNARAVAEIQALAVAPAGLVPPPEPARYPVPVSHEAVSFLERHAPADGAECSTCHVREDCGSCHLDLGAGPFQALFEARDVQAPGVGVEAVAPASHASPFFLEDHALAAATDAGRCASCHTRPFCTQCHEDARAPGFHQPDFVQRHAADAYGRNLDCANCHQAEGFCRACHIEVGLGTEGRLTVGYHDAEPVWLLRHGQAARQALETCQTCHAQRECLQCHSQTGSFQVSPHGPDFDARRVQERNPAVCFACHLADPLEPGR